MELTTKTTILFPPQLHERLVRVARRRGVSLGHLVRSACEAQYAAPSREARLEAVRELVELEAPVGTVEELVAESVPRPEDLLP